MIQLLAPSGALSGALASPRIGLGILAATWQTHTVSPPTITAQIRQTFDIHRDLSPTVSLNNVLTFEYLSDPVDIIPIQIITVHGVGEINLVEDFSGRC